MSIIHTLILSIFMLMLPNQANRMYQLKVKFELEKPLYFPDFTIEYTGKKSVPGPGNVKWTMTTFYFTVRKDEESKQVTWSSGAGDISATPFEINQHKFTLELVFSEKIKSWLKSNEMVISKK
jgi:hypothetical protein